MPHMPHMRNIALVAVGGGVGAMARVAVSAAGGVTDSGWPWGTLTANLTGALLLGMLLARLSDTAIGGVRVRPLVGTGVLGSYTTLSTMALEIERLAVGRGQVRLAVVYAVVSLMGGLLAAWVGAVVARVATRTLTSR